MSGINNEKRTHVHFVAGITGGLVNCVTLQPFDLIKTRIQQSYVNDRSMYSLTREIVKNDGISGLWKGTIPTILRNVPGSAAYLVLLNQIRQSMKSYQKISTEQPLSPLSNLMAGGVSRATVGYIMMPLTVLKSRYESSLFQYGGIRSALSSIVHREGYSALFAGFGSTALRDAPYAGIYVAFYDLFKSVDLKGVSRTAANVICASSAGFLATTITHPFDVIRLKIQVKPHKYRNSLQTLGMIMKEHGPMGLMTGISPRLMRKTLSAVITWTIYEEIIALMKS